MKRPANTDNVLQRIRKWREICPELVIRSTFIVGFPGETEEDFNILLDFLREAELDRVGLFHLFAGGRRRRQRAARPGARRSKEDRKARLMELQAEISAAAWPPASGKP